MHQMVSANLATSRRWWVLAIVVAAQFIFGVDAFVVNVAIPTIAAELHASHAEIESVIAIYLIAYATLVVTGGRLGDIYGTKLVFLAGVLGFTLTSLWCGLARSGTELIIARLAQYVAAGVSKFILRPLGGDDAQILAQTRQLIEQVLPAVEARWPRKPPHADRA